MIGQKPRGDRLTWHTHFNYLQQREEVFLQPILEEPQYEVLFGDRRMKQRLLPEESEVEVTGHSKGIIFGVIVDVLEFPPWRAASHPPIDDASQGLQALLTPSLPLSSFHHAFQRLQSLRVMNRTALDEKCEGAQPVRECARQENFLQE